jgi:RNA polymerase sigma-70 factor (ECF subfamily)
MNVTRWFAEEVHPHAPLLRSYLRGTFPAVRDVDDLVQESILRVWRSHLAEPVRSAKSFLFQVARHLAFDQLRRDRGRAIPSHEFDATAVPEEAPDAAEALAHRERIALLSDALAALPHRCREVVYLRRLCGCSQKEVATRLGISVRTVESQYLRGLRLCAAYLRRRGVAGSNHDA